MSQPKLDPETVRSEAIRILRNLRDGDGRQSKLAEVKSRFESSGSLEFETYFFFLRKFSYIELDREAHLKLTEAGERVVRGEDAERFEGEIASFISEKSADSTDSGAGRPRSAELTDLEALIGEELGARAAYPMPPPSPRPPQAISQASGTHSSQHTVRVNVLELRRDRSEPLPASGLALASSRDGELELRYVRAEAVGAGPLGTVFKARHQALGTEVCVKELKDIFGYFSFLQRGEVVKRLKKEICAQAQVSHPNVVTILDQNIEAARPYLVTELLRGSLRGKLQAAEGRGLDPAEAIRGFLQACYALKAAHGSGLTHHNLKPENLLFDGFGNVSLGDFGLSRVIETDSAKGMPQLFVGTGGMGYMAPELMGRGKEAGPAADVYGLGILLYEVLAGQLPGRRSPLPSELNAQIPKGLDAIFDRMTQDRIESRYPDFDAVLGDFYSAFADGAYGRPGDLLLRS